MSPYPALDLFGVIWRDLRRCLACHSWSGSKCQQYPVRPLSLLFTRSEAM